MDPITIALVAGIADYGVKFLDTKARLKMSGVLKAITDYIEPAKRIPLLNYLQAHAQDLYWGIQSDTAGSVFGTSGAGNDTKVLLVNAFSSIGGVNDYEGWRVLQQVYGIFGNTNMANQERVAADAAQSAYMANRPASWSTGTTGTQNKTSADSSQMLGWGAALVLLGLAIFYRKPK